MEIIELALETRTDSLGGYTFAGVSRGNYTLRFSAPVHYAIVAIAVVGDEDFQLDISLTPIPVQLDKISVSSTANLAGGTRVIDESGSWIATGDAIFQTPLLAERDAFRILGETPQAQLSLEAPATVHVRGGSADQNLVSLDGVPVFNPIHSGEVFSAFNPDMIESVLLHGGAPAARFGGRLSSIIDVRTRKASPTDAAARGAFGPTAARATLDLPVPALGSAISFSGRHSYEGLFGRRRAGPDRTGWSDFLGRATLTPAGNSLEFLLFSSSDRVAFGSSRSNSPSASPPQSQSVGAPAGFGWSSLTAAAVWQGTQGRTHSAIRSWRSEMKADIRLPAGAGSAFLSSRAQSEGFSADISHSDRRGSSGGSLTVTREPTSYVLSEVVPPNTSPTFPEPLNLSSSPTVAAASIDRRQVLGSRWTISAGLRGTAVTNDRLRLDPRVSVGFTPMEGAQLSVGYARVHQHVQSLRNEESLLDAVIGIDLPVAFGAPGVPVATGDGFVAIGAVPIGSGNRITISTYSNWSDGIVLVAPLSVRPFATQSFARGVGRAWGGSIAAQGIAGHFGWTSTYAFAEVRRAAFGKSYHPSFAPTHSASASGNYLLGRRTRFKASVWAAKGRPTTPVSGGFGWEWQGSISRARRITGIPINATGVISTQTLPVYFRLDAGATHEFPIGRKGSRIDVFVNVDNVLDRRNTIGYSVESDTGGPSQLRMSPVSATFGLEWRF